jgi:hypothetical protein
MAIAVKDKPIAPREATGPVAPGEQAAVTEEAPLVPPEAVVVPPRRKSRTELKREQYALLHAELDEELRTHYVDVNDFGTRLHTLSTILKRVHETRDPAAIAEVRKELPSIQEFAEAFRLSPIVEAITQYMAVLDAEAALDSAVKKNGIV